MNNFTKSIVYSGVVLAAGLVAIFAIYNNMGTDGSNVSYIEPAAGEQLSEDISEAYDNTVEAIEETATDAGAAISETAEKATEAVAETAEDAATAIEETIENADMTETPEEVETQEASDNSPEDRTAKGEDVQQTEPASGDAVIENAKELLENSKTEAETEAK